MSISQNTKHPLKRKGTSQSERFPLALSNEYVKIDERTFEDLIAQTAELSKYFNYFESSSNFPDGSWNIFFEEIYDFSTKKSKISSLAELSAKANTTPHLALFLSFLELFNNSIQHINSLGEKHLLFFYKEMLHLKIQEGVAPKVTLFGEIGKNQNQVLIPKGTSFKANKNILGDDIYFKSDEDNILNQAVVSEIKNINFLNSSITARSISNSADGNGEGFTDDPKAWFAFGQKEDRATEIGFCIASPLFLINDGSRIITLFLKNANLNDFQILISTKDGWTPFQFTPKKTNTINDTATLKIEETFAEIIPFDTEIHQSNLNTQFPVLKFILKNSSTAAFSYYKNFKPYFTITINLDKLRNLTLQNDNGKLDASKPFQPFGNNPIKNLSEIIIGHPLIFNKYLKGNLTFSATGKVDSQISKILYLKNSNWGIEKADYNEEFTGDYSVKSKSNYIKYSYNGDYSREKYISGFINKIRKTPPADDISIAKEEIPVWKDLFATANLEFTQNQNEIYQFFHLHPFGAVSKNNSDDLLPKYESASYLLIGISNWNKRETISIHFEMLDGSGNQELNHPIINWAVYGNNILMPLSKQAILKDTTLNLAQTGLIKFAIKDEMYQKNSLLDDEKIWLVAICPTNFEAIPKFIDISAQAFLATYQMPNPALVEDIFSNAISKSEIPISGLKKIIQPYKSFGGRPTEDEKSFVTRSSEHLRHKGKAITIFDYERILLEKFPFLYLVKCISHSNSSTEMAPGNVLIILIPKLKKDNTQNLLKPTVSLGSRVLIKNYLEKIISPFINIEVRNPNYKEVKIEMNVKYFPQYSGDKEFYNSLLNTKLREYISSWLLPEGEISFNKEGFVSSYINHIEDLEYVDNITHFKIFVDGIEIKNKIEASKEDVIFTSAENHLIKNEELC